MMRSKSTNNFCKTSLFGGTSRVIRRATDTQLGLSIKVAPNPGLAQDHEWTNLLTAEISFFRNDPEMSTELSVGLWEEINMKMGCRMAEFMVHADLIELMDPNKLASAFDCDGTKTVLGNMPFILLAKDPGLYPEQIRFWDGYSTRTPECRFHFQEIFDTYGRGKSNGKPAVTVPTEWLIDYAALLRKEGESVRLKEVTNAILKGSQ